MLYADRPIGEFRCRSISGDRCGVTTTPSLGIERLFR
jgi:hypothetical protein